MLRGIMPAFFSLTSEIRASKSDGRGQLRNFEDKHLRTINIKCTNVS